MNIAVIGGSKCSEKYYKTAKAVGELIAKEGWTLICGGGPGVMEAACSGAKKKKGLTVGILPSYDGHEANSYLDVKIPTGLGFIRNTLVVRAADYLIAIDGKYGTLSEIGFALSEGKIVVGIDTWDIKGIIKTKTAKDAIGEIKRYVKQEGN
ncbi:MAG: TIGR00725 family protein [Candidatus Omnitrophica bacterium]|nr:TIGR00725 family protein [Candidatus Omnitrophota bacterium]MCF7892184.1 TIGR00725 family protein [Candidatus Omnitrophota bacterium]MCF7897438.1 TIGR00725 family protein [Candidatus Omnitrophota bacterium]MCF7909384.1 TIGR00725 family protein [Candidatus Omnitrophota bacterium]